MLHCTKTTHLQTAVQLRWIWVAISSLVVYSTDWWYSSSTFDHWDFLLINRNNIIIDKRLPLTKTRKPLSYPIYIEIIGEYTLIFYYIYDVTPMYQKIKILMYYTVLYFYCKYHIDNVVHDITQFILDVNWLTWH